MIYKVWPVVGMKVKSEPILAQAIIWIAPLQPMDVTPDIRPMVLASL
jgi:hypothetical protein